VYSGSSGGAERAAAGVPLKLENQDSIDASWLADFDSSTSEYMRRLETDRSIIAELRASGFAGVHYNYFATEMAKYGIAVMAAWIRTHQIFEKMRQRGRGGITEPQGDELRDQETATELAMETVAAALANFRTHVLIPGKWDPAKGASIRTYFIGQCLIQFSNIYRSWYRETFERVPWSHLANEAHLTARGYEHVESAAANQVGVAGVLSKVKRDRTKEILVLRGAGHTHDDIAARLQISVKTVEMTIRNERNRQIRGEAS
jgi:DNA-directed RNA polymerase specialized sigma24 family protein